MTDSNLAKREVGKVAKRNVKRAVEPVTLKQSAPAVEPVSDFGELAQVIVTGSEGQADKLAKLEVQSFSDQMKRNVPAVASAKAQVAQTIFGIMSDAWDEAMNLDYDTTEDNENA